MGYEILEHTADVRVRVSGGTFEEFLRSAALAMMNLLCDTKTVRPAQETGFEVEGETKEELLIRMLGEILYINRVEQKVFSAIDLELVGENKVRGTLHGEELDPDRHELELDIKAATYHNLKIRRVNDRFVAEIVFDI